MEFSSSFSLFRFLFLSEQFKKLEEKTGYSKVYFFAGAVLTTIFTVWLIGGSKLITDLLGFVYPAYMSFQSMEASKGGVSDGSTQWLTYWVVFSFITLLESVIPAIANWIPMYYYNKAGLVIWLYHPQSNGAEVVYNQLVRKYILPHLQVKSAKAE